MGGPGVPRRCWHAVCGAQARGRGGGRRPGDLGEVEALGSPENFLLESLSLSRVSARAHRRKEISSLLLRLER